MRRRQDVKRNINIQVNEYSYFSTKLKGMLENDLRLEKRRIKK